MQVCVYVSVLAAADLVWLYNFVHLFVVYVDLSAPVVHGLCSSDNAIPY